MLPNYVRVTSDKKSGVITRRGRRQGPEVRRRPRQRARAPRSPSCSAASRSPRRSCAARSSRSSCKDTKENLVKAEQIAADRAGEVGRDRARQAGRGADHRRRAAARPDHASARCSSRCCAPRRPSRTRPSSASTSELRGTARRAGADGIDQGGAPGSAVDMPVGKIPEAAVDYVRARRELKLQETLLEGMLRQYEIAKLDEAKEGPVLQQVDIARPPTTSRGHRAASSSWRARSRRCCSSRRGSSCAATWRPCAPTTRPRRRRGAAWPRPGASGADSRRARTSTTYRSTSPRTQLTLSPPTQIVRARRGRCGRGRRGPAGCPARRRSARARGRCRSAIAPTPALRLPVTGSSLMPMAADEAAHLEARSRRRPDTRRRRRPCRSASAPRASGSSASTVAAESSSKAPARAVVQPRARRRTRSGPSRARRRRAVELRRRRPRPARSGGAAKASAAARRGECAPGRRRIPARPARPLAACRRAASQAWQVPSVGWPANGSSPPGVKMRTR